jgi:Domain of unknown function (DUF4349)
MKSPAFIVLGIVMLCLGCADQARSPAAKDRSAFAALSAESVRPEKPPASPRVPTPPNATGRHPRQEEIQIAAGQIGQPLEKQAAKPDPPAERKIKYTADLRMICDDFAKSEEYLLAAITKHKGLIAHSEMTATPGSPRSGQWRVRVPIPELHAFREEVRKLGEIAGDTLDSEDVTELYYDLENHIKNKLAEEESLRKLLEKSGGEKMENILAIRRELAEVRDDINRKQGKLRLLANLTELTTVTVTLRERQKYAPAPPPDIAEVPTFDMRIGRTFGASWDALVAFVQFLILAVVAAAPWLAIAAVVVGPAAVLTWRWRRTLPPVVQPVDPSPPPTPSA